MPNPLSVRRALASVAVAVLALSGTTLSAAAAYAAPPASSVVRMAALGDSITRATSSCSTLSGCLSNSWATGSSATVQSHFLRLRAEGAASLVAANYAVNGAMSGALPAQAQSAVTQGAQYVTIEIGANDACTSTVTAMTPAATYRDNVRAALATLAASGSSPEIFVASVPNLQRMYDLNKTSSTARFYWGLLRICQSMLANPTSTLPADVQRRAAVQARVNEYNQVLAEECTAALKCRFDGFAVANLQFAKSDISTRDYFHPSVAGQTKLAALTWGTSQWVVQ